ncbi:MAG: pimeloyl-ACP methyl ester carboxylesterase [Myxococcota bacterium]|jgi:pimeloyl-ACP methyl ester carboxylesterase
MVTPPVRRPGPGLPHAIAMELPFTRYTLPIDGHSVHFVDTGPADADVAVWLQHGNPTWCFLWRDVIRRLTGLRVVAPDLVGFGLSSKPRRGGFHTVEGHVARAVALADALGVRRWVLVGQDWGGPIVAGLGAARPDRVAGLVLANTAVLPPRRPIRSTPFHRLARVPGLADALFVGCGFPLGMLHTAQADRRSLPDVAMRAYRYPFTRRRDRAGPLALARMVPGGASHPSVPALDRIGKWVQSYRGPTELVWGVADPILGRAVRRHARELSHAAVTTRHAGHFLQEEVPGALAAAIHRVHAGGATVSAG